MEGSLTWLEADMSTKKIQCMPVNGETEVQVRRVKKLQEVISPQAAVITGAGVAGATGSFPM